MQAPIRPILSSLTAIMGILAIVFVVRMLLTTNRTGCPPHSFMVEINNDGVSEEAPEGKKQTPPPLPPNDHHHPPEVSFDAMADIQDRPESLVEPIDAPADAPDTLTPSETEAPSDRPLTPVVRVEPTYPPIAASRGITGWVIVQFTVTANGRVQDVRVTDASPHRIFDDAAVQAVRRWQYQPRVIDGQPVSTPHQKAKLTFTLD